MQIKTHLYYRNKGEGGEKNVEKAFYWCKKAADQGHDEAKKIRICQRGWDTVTDSGIARKSYWQKDVILGKLLLRRIRILGLIRKISQVVKRVFGEIT